jgi:hypothetical protein
MACPTVKTDLMTSLEKSFFKIITGWDYGKLNPDDLHVKISVKMAKACASKCEEVAREAYMKSYDDNVGDLPEKDNSTLKVIEYNFEDYLKTLREQ